MPQAIEIKQNQHLYFRCIQIDVLLIQIRIHNYKKTLVVKLLKLLFMAQEPPRGGGARASNSHYRRRRGARGCPQRGLVRYKLYGDIGWEEEKEE